MLIRPAETATDDTWPNLRHELDRMHLDEFAGPAGRALQRTETTADHAAIFKALGVAQPKRFLGLTPAGETPQSTRRAGTTRPRPDRA